MRFKSRLAYEHVQLLHNVIVPISRLTGGGGGPDGNSRSSIGSGTTMYLDPEVLRISSRGGAGRTSDGGGINSSQLGGGGGGDVGVEGISCFTELIAMHGIFLDLKIESIADNVIVFDIDLVQLRTALAATLQSLGGGSGNSSGAGGGDGAKTTPLYNSGGGGEDYRNSSYSSRRRSSSSFYSTPSVIVVMKLAKRGGLPCLCLDTSCANGTLDIHHAVPVRILRAEEWQNHLPPVVPHPDVQLEFQLDRPFRPVIERLKALSPTIYLEGSMAGELVLRIDNDAVSIKTFYDKLIPRIDDESPHFRSEDPASCTLKVDSKKLLASLQWQSSMTRSSVSSYIFCMIENEMLVVHVLLNPEDVGFFTYYIPVHYLSSDMMD
jgi:HUS1 checkpoint protein